MARWPESSSVDQTEFILWGELSSGWTGVADCHDAYGDYDLMKPRDAFPKAREYALKAIEIHPRLAEPYVTLVLFTIATTGCGSGQKKSTRKQSNLDQATQPRSSSVPPQVEEAYDELKRASEFDPLSRLVKLNRSSALLYLGKSEYVFAQYEKIVEQEPEWAAPHLHLGIAYCLESKIEEAINELKKTLVLSKGDPAVKADLTGISGFVGRRDVAERLLGELLDYAKTAYVSKVKVAEVLFGLGRTDEAFDSLEEAYGEKSIFPGHFRVLPWFGEARKDIRWDALTKRIGLQ